MSPMSFNSRSAPVAGAAGPRAGAAVRSPSVGLSVVTSSRRLTTPSSAATPQAVRQKVARAGMLPETNCTGPSVRRARKFPVFRSSPRPSCATFAQPIPLSPTYFAFLRACRLTGSHFCRLIRSFKSDQLFSGLNGPWYDMLASPRLASPRLASPRLAAS